MKDWENIFAMLKVFMKEYTRKSYKLPRICNKKKKKKRKKEKEEGNPRGERNTSSAEEKIQKFIKPVKRC